MTDTLDIGTGVYTFPEAAHILAGGGHQVTSGQLRRWITKGLARPVSVLADETTTFPVLTFEDLISLEVVRRFRAQGTSLQKVARLDKALRDRFPTLDHPFAYQTFFTDGAAIWIAVDGEDPDGPLVELVGRHQNHYTWRDAIKTFAKEIRWSKEPTPKAVGWQLSPWVDIDPDIQFGTPVVTGTRIPIRTIAANLKEGNPEDVAAWYGLDADAVRGVADYLALSA